MADRDVKLIIRAKNEATRTIESVSSALNDLEKSQKKVGSSAAKTDDLIGRLGQEFQKLNSQVSALGALDKVAGFLDRAGSAVGNLKQGVSGAEAKFAELSKSATEAAASTKELEKQATALNERQKQQRSEMEAARKATLRNSEAQKELTQARKAYNDALKVKEGTAGRDGGIATTKATLDAAQAAVNANVESYKRLKGEYTGTKTEAASLDKQIRESTKNQNQLANAASDAEVALGRQRTNLAKGEHEFAQLRTVIDGAASALGNVSTKQSDLAASLATLIPQAERLGRTMAAMQRYSTGGGAFVDPKSAAAFRAQRAEMDKTEQTWRTLQSEAKRLAREMRGVAQPTQEQVAAFKQVTAAAAAAKAEYRANQSALYALQGTAKSTFAEFAASTSPLKRVGQDLEAARQRTEALEAAVKRYSTGAGGFANAEQAASMRKQADAVDVARKRYELLRSEVQRFQAQISASGASTAGEAQQLRNLASAANLAEKEFREAASAMKGMQQSSRSGGLFGGAARESRQAMSLFQRLRGELLSLSTAYVGLYGTISNIGNVIGAYQKFEAAQNRLGAVFEQNASSIRNEMGWLERQAARLGIGFDVLSDEYSKFAVATKAAGFESEATRKVFLRVAEAGRVNKLSMQQMSLIFLALQQMISKGKIQSEELRRQLGDQLPGAFNIMADAIGVTTAELDDMMKKGEVIANQDTMLKFADELNKRFGPQLSEALRSTTTQIGLLSNNLYRAQLMFAKGGFIQSFTDLLRDMNQWFQTDDAVSFFMSMGAAAGGVVDIVHALFDNMDLVLNVVRILVTMKAASWLTGIANNAVAASRNMSLLSAETKGLATAQNVALGSTNSFFGLLGRSTGLVSYVRNLSLAETKVKLLETATKVYAATTNLSQARMAAASAMTSAWAGSLAVLRGGLAAARVAVTGLLTALGGPAGIAIAVGTYFATELIASWVGEVDKATEAIEKHKNFVNSIVEKYESLPEATRSWAEALKGIPLDQIDGKLKEAKDTVAGLKSQLVGNVTPSMKSWWGGWSAERDELEKLRGELNDGQITAKRYREAIERIYNGLSDDGAKEFVRNQLEVARQLEEASLNAERLQDASDKARQGIDGLRGTLSDVKGPLDEATAAADDNAKAFDAGAESAEAYKEALEKIKGFIPGLAAEMKKMKDLTEIQSQFGSIGFNNITPEMARYGKQAVEAVLSEADQKIFKEIAGNTKVSKEMFNDIFKEESFRNKAYDDGYGTWTIGYGSTRLNGKAVQQGDYVTKDEGMKQAIGDLDKLIAQIESMVKVALSDGQLRALVSYAYNAGIGSLKRDGILAPLNRGDYAGAEAAIRNGVTTSKGKEVPTLKKRRQREADLFASGADDPKVVKQVAEQKEKIAEAEKKAGDATKKRIEDQKFEITQQDLKNVGKEREAAIEKAIRDAKAENPKISAEELETIRQQTGALWDKQQLKKAEKEENKQIKEAMKEVNLLEQQRNALLATRKTYQDQGNTEKVKEVNAELAGVNTKLQEAIDKAIAMHQALGGATADATIGKLEAMKGKIVAAGDGMRKMAMTAGEMQSAIFSNLESGIISAFDSFAQAVANGENAIQALGNAFRQFAASFLMEIAKMILKQIMFNALQSISRALTGGIMSIVAHTGGIVGQSVSGSRTVAPGWFAGATRYHTGGIAGLKPNEVPAILEVGEEVLTEQDARHSKNLGKGGSDGASGRTKIVNMFDAASFLSEAMHSAIGEETILNFVRANPAAFKAAMG
ncbi:tape measure protein [Ochrobactrum sp. WV_118_8]